MATSCITRWGYCGSAFHVKNLQKCSPDRFVWLYLPQAALSLSGLPDGLSYGSTPTAAALSATGTITGEECNIFLGLLHQVLQ